MYRFTTVLPNPLVSFTLLVVFIAQLSRASFSLTYCSSQNTGSSSDKLDHVWQSNGWCHDQCVSNYAFAVVQDQSCWCSNYIPAQQQSTGDCNEDCPGFPDEKCGKKGSLFGYVALDKKPSGTQGASQPSATVSTPSASLSFVSSNPPPMTSSGPTILSPSSSPSMQTSFLIVSSTSLVVISSWITLSTYLTLPFLSPSSPPSSVSSPESRQDPETVFKTLPGSTSVVTVTPSNSPSSTPPPPPPPTTMITTPSSSAPSTTFSPTPVTEVKTMTVSGVVVTQTVTGMSTAAPALSEPEQKKSNTGAIVGGVVGGLGGLALVGALGFLLFRRRQRNNQDDDGSTSGIQRNTSTMSKSGLLRPSEKTVPPVNTSVNRSSRHMDTDSISPVSGSERRNSRPFIFDQRLNPSAIMDLDNGSRSSLVTMDDNRDYTRTLNIRNPDPDTR